jgi:hypothetical protein
MSLTAEDNNWITEQLRTVETSLLTEFHKWAFPSEARQRTHTAVLRAVDLEMEALSERVAKLAGTVPSRSRQG